MPFFPDPRLPRLPADNVGGCALGHRLPGRVGIALVTWVIVPVVLGACERSAERPASYPDGTIAAILEADDRFDTLMQIIENDAPRVFLDSFTSIGTEGRRIDITWFAPTDEAFAALPPETLDWLLDDANVSDLQVVLDHHAILMAYSLGDLRSKVQSGEGEVRAIGGGPIRVTLAGDVLRVDEATVIDGDIDAENGVIHVIDTVLIPDSVTLPGT